MCISTGTGDEAESAVQIDSPIESETGTITITSLDGDSTTDDITFGAGGDITSTSGTVTLNADGSFVYTPDQDYDGPTDSFTYQVSDGAETETATVEITVLADMDTPVTQPDSYVVDFETTLVVWDGSFSRS